MSETRSSDVYVPSHWRLLPSSLPPDPLLDASARPSETPSTNGSRRKRQSSDNDHTSLGKPTRRPIVLNSPQRSAIYPIPGGHGIKTNKAANEMLYTHSNGDLYALRCPFCDADHLDTQQGLGQHLAGSHKLPHQTNDEVLLYCSVRVEGPITQVPLRDISEWDSIKAAFREIQDQYSEDADDNEGDTINLAPVPNRPAAKPATNASLPHRQSMQPQQSPRYQTHTERTRPSRSTSSRPPIRASAAFSPPDDSYEPQFHFVNDSDGFDKPRIRPLSVVKDVLDFYGQAQAGGLLQERTVSLSVHITDHTPLHVVEEDEEDFQTVLDTIYELDRKTVGSRPMVVVRTGYGGRRGRV